MDTPGGTLTRLIRALRGQPAKAGLSFFAAPILIERALDA